MRELAKRDPRVDLEVVEDYDWTGELARRQDVSSALARPVEGHPPQITINVQQAAPAADPVGLPWLKRAYVIGIVATVVFMVWVFALMGKPVSSEVKSPWKHGSTFQGGTHTMSTHKHHHKVQK
jgi:hypothetical protein